MAAPRLDRRSDHHRGGARAQYRGARARRKEVDMTMAESSAFTPPPLVAHTATVSEALHEKVSVRGLNFYYGDNRALKDVTVALYAGLVTAFIGPSGCGK